MHQELQFIDLTFGKNSIFETFLDQFEVPPIFNSRENIPHRIRRLENELDALYKHLEKRGLPDKFLKAVQNIRKHLRLYKRNAKLFIEDFKRYERVTYEIMKDYLHFLHDLWIKENSEDISFVHSIFSVVLEFIQKFMNQTRRLITHIAQSPGYYGIISSKSDIAAKWDDLLISYRNLLDMLHKLYEMEKRIRNGEKIDDEEKLEVFEMVLEMPLPGIEE